MKLPLNRVVSWGHELLAEVIRPGDLGVDLTAGNGYDTLVLARQVGETGQVVAFDIQAEAIAKTCKRLQEAGFQPRVRGEERVTIEDRAGIDLVTDGHQYLAKYLPGQPQAIVANLGYLPGGDAGVTTSIDSTIQALEQSSHLLAPGGRMAVVVYVGHPGGMDEGVAVSRFFSELDDSLFQSLQLKVLNRPRAPYLLVAEKNRPKGCAAARSRYERRRGL